MTSFSPDIKATIGRSLAAIDAGHRFVVVTAIGGMLAHVIAGPAGVVVVGVGALHYGARHHPGIVFAVGIIALALLPGAAHAEIMQQVAASGRDAAEQYCHIGAAGDDGAYLNCTDPDGAPSQPTPWWVYAVIAPISLPAAILYGMIGNDLRKRGYYGEHQTAYEAIAARFRALFSGLKARSAS